MAVVARGVGADLSALLACRRLWRLTRAVRRSGDRLVGHRHCGEAAGIGLSEVVPLMLKFYRDAAPHARPRRAPAPH